MLVKIRVKGQGIGSFARRSSIVGLVLEGSLRPVASKPFILGRVPYLSHYALSGNIMCYGSKENYILPLKYRLNCVILCRQNVVSPH